MHCEKEYDVFFSHSSLDHPKVNKILDELIKQGLNVWFDDKEILDYEGITKSIEQGLANSKTLLAYYSHNYPRSRACQYELTSALIAAHQIGDKTSRILVVNPEKTYDHIHPVELKDESQPNRCLVSGNLDQLAGTIKGHIHKIDTVFGKSVNRQKIGWYGKTGIGSSRFVGRLPIMWEIHSALHSSSFYIISKSHTPAIAQLIGMGGIGKSLIAEEYALWFATAFPGGVFWLNAFGNDEVKSTLRPEEREAERIRQILNIASQYGIIAENKKPDEIIIEFNQKLTTSDLPFLWIVDDLPSGMTRNSFENWLAPVGSQGRILITTRTTLYTSFGTPIQVDPLEPDEALELLSKWKKPHGLKEEDAAKELAKNLGCHPLALDVAGSQLKRSISPNPFTDFNHDLADQTTDTLELSKAFVGLLPTGHEVSIAKTLFLSTNQMDTEGQDFLHLASVLATAPIPGELVSKVFSNVDLLDEKAGRQRAEKAIFQAEQHSLAKREGNNPATWSVHTIITRTVRFQDTKDIRFKKMRDAAVETLTGMLSIIADGRIHRELELVMPHAREIVTTGDDLQTGFLIGHVGKFDMLQGSYQSAEILCRHQIEIFRRVTGEKSHETISAMNNLAFTLIEQGNLPKARVLQERVLELSKVALGGEHPDTLTAMGNLALSLVELGNLPKARILQEKELELSMKVLGSEHPKTLSVMGNLAVTYFDQGNLPKARVLQERVLELSKRTLGEEHPSTITAMGNLAGTLRHQGDFPGARLLQEKELEVSIKVLGSEHPKTLITLNNFAGTRIDQGDLSGAKVIQEKVVELSKKIRGSEHPNTIMAMNNLALTLRNLGDLPRAKIIQEDVLKLSKKILGSEHPNTIMAMNNLALTLKSQGDLPGARILLENVLDLSKKILGNEHTRTSVSACNLLSILYLMNENKEADKIMEKYLLWLVERDPKDLDAQQREIRDSILSIQKKI